MLKKITVLSILLMLAVLAVFGYVLIPGVRQKVASYTEEEFNEDNIYNNIIDISGRLQKEIEKGSDSFVIYINDMPVDDLSELNGMLNGIWGSGSSYQQIGSVGDNYKKIRITIEKTSNYYAVQAYVKGTPIPESDERAKRLYDAISKIMSSYVTVEMSDLEKEVALHDYLVRHCTYSEAEEWSHESDVFRAYGALVNGEAVCNGYAEALQLLFTCAGIPSKFVMGMAEDVEHAWNLVELDGKWYHVDATWDDPLPDQGEDVIHTYVNVSDDEIATVHTWNRADYPKAENTDMNYYRKTNTYFQSFEEYKERAYDALIRNGQRYYEAAVVAETVQDEDMQFLFEGESTYDSANWKCYDEPGYKVLIVSVGN